MKILFLPDSKLSLVCCHYDDDLFSIFIYSTRTLSNLVTFVQISTISIMMMMMIITFQYLWQTSYSTRPPPWMTQ